ncbi:MAG: hypothetical protein OEV24_05780 [Cyclobacteriaceae bacterium]|nr:hypothetical protein [Cyclobacteriaceae bacterium]MDH5247592.1 hypothetical protein [Cyclobacteriaceae bacterium]
MKILITILATLFSLSAANALTPAGHFASGKSKDSLFVLRAEKKFVGAIVEIYASTGELVTSKSLNKRKMIIDFGSVMKDTYTIVVVKGDEKQEFQYEKK